MKGRVAAIQMVSGMDVESNLEDVSRLVANAANMEVDAVFLPENFAALASADPRAIGVREMDANGPIRRHISALAKEYQCWIFAGTLPTSVRADMTKVPEPRVRAASFVFDHQGREVARYDKMHMFDVDVADVHQHYRESTTFEHGRELEYVDSVIGRVGLSVCYDLRFPELYRALALQQVKIFSIPSAFTAITGKAHFEVLVRSRAIENACFVIAACQGGEHDSGRATYGHSMIVDPWGTILSEASTGEDIVVAELDFDRQEVIRREMPVLSQRRLHV